MDEQTANQPVESQAMPQAIAPVLPPPLPDEEPRWYDSFLTYLLLGSRRSILAAFNAQREKEGLEPTENPSGQWFVKAREWDWRERALQWDREQQARDAAWLEQRRIVVRERSIDALRVHLEKLVEASKGLDPSDAGWRDVSHGLRVAVSELAKLTDTQPVREREDVLGQIVSALPRGMRVQILAQLERS
jgi:hypothetical protein